MKTKQLFLKIYVFLLVFCILILLTLSVLGSKTRVGYLGEFIFDEYQINDTLKLNGLSNVKENFTIDSKLDIESIKNFIFTNDAITNYSYVFRIKYYDKIFRNSDVYGVYPDIDKILKENDFVKEIILDGYGSPFGNLISDKIITEEKIDNVNYFLKVKNIFYINIFILVLFYIYIINKDRIILFIKKLKIYNTNVELNISSLIILGYLYLIVPYMIFIVTWTKYYISVPIIILLIITLYLMIKNTLLNYNKVYNINLLVVISIIIMIILFIVIFGIGEIFNQSGDMRSGRNAMFRDLINFSWPIIYPKNGYGFVYYFAHWVIPSIAGKLFGFKIGLLFLVLWSALGIFIFFVLILNLFNVKSNKYILASLIIFIFFSPIEYYMGGIFIEYASIAKQIYNLFNQSIAIWIMCTLFLYQKNCSNFAFLGLSVVFYSPYAIIGILPYMLVKVIIDVKNNKILELKNIFSIENILSSISIFPILFLYVISSDASNDGISILITKHNYIRLLINYMLSFGLLMIFLYRSNKNNYIFYTSIFVFIFVSMIRYSQDHNFSRTNLTAIFFLVLFVIRYFNDNMNIKSIKKYIIILLCIVGSYSSIYYFDTQISRFLDMGRDSVIIGRETFNTFDENTENDWTLKTITCQNMDKSIFFKYIAKDKKE